MDTHSFFIHGVTPENEVAVKTALSRVVGLETLEKDNDTGFYILTTHPGTELQRVCSEVIRALTGSGASLKHAFPFDKFK